MFIRSGRIMMSHGPRVFFAIAPCPRRNFLNTCPYVLTYLIINPDRSWNHSYADICQNTPHKHVFINGSFPFIPHELLMDVYIFCAHMRSIYVQILLNAYTCTCLHYYTYTYYYTCLYTPRLIYLF